MSSKIYPIPENEIQRVAALNSYNIFDNLSEEEFEDVTRLVAYICQVPFAHVSFMDDKRLLFKSTIGFEAKEMPREETFCQYTLMGNELMEVPNTLENEQLKNDANVQGGFKVRFYAGHPLTTPDGYNIGTVCAFDTKPKQLNEDQKITLSLLAKHIIVQLELRKKNFLLDKQTKIARQAVEAKDSFLANMSHEIRTPLNAIIGFTDLLAQSQLDLQQQDYVKSVQLAGDNLLVIVNDILDLSKMESGNLTIDSHTFNLKDTLRHIYSLLKVKVKPDLDFNLYLDANMPDMVMGDRARLTQILVNLVGNAIKFTHEGEVTLSVKHLSENASHHKLKFVVKDTGIGIPQDKLETIFERFTQAEDSTTRRFGGTGLGLNIVKQLVELQKGEISVKSKIGSGSEFYFIIEFGKADDSINIVTQAVPVSKGDLKILLCEDNELNQKLAKNVIQNFGFSIDIANNGQEGIDLLEHTIYDVILMDLQMPVMDGYQATQYIREKLKLTTPIIAMTAHSLVGEQEKCFQTGMNGYVPKPFKQAELLEAIQTVISKDNKSTKPRNIDFSYLHEMTGADAAFIKEMVTIFVTNTPKEVEELASSVEKAEYVSAAKIAHSMKSGVALFKLDDFTDCLDTIEQEALGNNFTQQSVSKISILKHEIENVVKSLNTTINNQ